MLATAQHDKVWAVACGQKGTCCIACGRAAARTPHRLSCVRTTTHKHAAQSPRRRAVTMPCCGGAAMHRHLDLEAESEFGAPSRRLIASAATPRPPPLRLHLLMQVHVDMVPEHHTQLPAVSDRAAAPVSQPQPQPQPKPQPQPQPQPPAPIRATSFIAPILSMCLYAVVAGLTAPDGLSGGCLLSSVVRECGSICDCLQT